MLEDKSNETEHLMTKEDLQKIKVWVLGGVLAGMVAGATLLMLYHKFFMSG